MYNTHLLIRNKISRIGLTAAIRRSAACDRTTAGRCRRPPISDRASAIASAFGAKPASVPDAGFGHSFRSSNGAPFVCFCRPISTIRRWLPPAGVGQPPPSTSTPRGVVVWAAKTTGLDLGRDSRRCPRARPAHRDRDPDHALTPRDSLGLQHSVCMTLEGQVRPRENISQAAQFFNRVMRGRYSRCSGARTALHSSGVYIEIPSTFHSPSARGLSS